MIAGVVLVAMAAAPPQIYSESPDEVGVVDGETITIRGTRVELGDVAAPMVAQRCDAGRAFVACGADARSALANLVAGKNVTCAVSAIRRSSWAAELDTRLGRCWVGRLDLAEELVDQGLAVPAPGSAYVNQGLSACLERRGIWSGSVESPWTYRARREGRDVPPVLIGALAKTPCLRAIEAPNLR